MLTSKKSKSSEAIYIHPSECSGYTLSEYGITYYAMSYCFGDIRVWSQKILIDCFSVSIIFDILVGNMS